MEVALMKLTKRSQVLLEEEQYKKLEKLAKQKKVSVGALIRAAIEKVYHLGKKDRIQAVQKIAAMDLPVDDWEKIEKEIIEGATK